ncbi:hypothetical protein HK102_000606 [Quaeritorhiza haematococci]|nr:hypothetical protein HK102_000606 [Quaeritorhiza haematococci]
MAADQGMRQRKSAAKSKDDKKDIVAQTGKTWGRQRDIGIAQVLEAAAIVAFCPLLVIYVWRACDAYKCELFGPVYAIQANGFTLDAVLNEFPKPTTEGFQLYFAWLAFQIFLYMVVPAKIGYGQATPAGYILEYVVNGLRVYFLTHILYFAASALGLINPAIIHDNWGALLVAVNVYGYGLSLFVFIKAYLFPSHAADRKFSSSWIYDFFWGIEFNPRIGKWFDFKLFHNGRPGIVAWTLIDLSFAAAQYQQLGYITNSMYLVTFLHALYVIDFFYNEDWYLRTIDVCHDHFGFYLAWGDSVWLPFMYTLQSHYLVRNPVDMSTPYFLFVFGMGMLGYYIFRATNNQKDIVRKTDGKCTIWGKPATFIRTEYATSDGKIHKSLLLTSGFWGWSRHFNYFGDLFISFAMCMTCGFTHILPYFYGVFMTCLLVARIDRDHKRCSGKYGKYWDEYCKKVPYKLIPYVW